MTAHQSATSDHGDDRNSDSGKAITQTEHRSTSPVQQVRVVKCPLGCAGEPRFQAKRNRLDRYQCGECHLIFETTRRSGRPAK
jgi:ribosomal protein S27AE